MGRIQYSVFYCDLSLMSQRTLCLWVRGSYAYESEDPMPMRGPYAYVRGSYVNVRGSYAYEPEDPMSMSQRTLCLWVRVPYAYESEDLMSMSEDPMPMSQRILCLWVRGPYVYVRGPYAYEDPMPVSQRILCLWVRGPYGTINQIIN